MQVNFKKGSVLSERFLRAKKIALDPFVRSNVSSPTTTREREVGPAGASRRGENLKHFVTGALANNRQANLNERSDQRTTWMGLPPG